MKACVLYSGGKDSSLISFLLEKLGYEVELLTANFSIFDSWISAKRSAESLGFKHNVLKMDKKKIETAVSIILDDGFPNNGINYLHKTTLETVAEKKYDLVADGTRRDDRVPKITMNEIRSLENKYMVEYVNLQGFGHRTINNLSENLFKFKKEESCTKNSDYETEIRLLIKKKENQETADLLFPKHFQTRVIGWKSNNIEIKNKY
ncbi:MAG: hypothetical protein Kow0019_01460 [Methanobacteriaceae archaeon]